MRGLGQARRITIPDCAGGRLNVEHDRKPTMTPNPQDQTTEELAARFNLKLEYRLRPAGDAASWIWPHLTPITARNKLEKLRGKKQGPVAIAQPESRLVYYTERNVLLWLASWSECASTSQAAETA